MNDSACFDGFIDHYLEGIREEFVVLHYFLIYSAFSDSNLSHSGHFLYLSTV